jgi:hypothetical protein
MGLLRPTRFQRFRLPTAGRLAMTMKSKKPTCEMGFTV